MKVWLTLWLAAAPAPWRQLDEAQRGQALEALKALPLEARVVAASERFLGTPYVNSPLGEGQGVDDDPLIRFDAVDCLTFVEEALALSLAPTGAQLLGTLNSLRYQTEAISYQSRNHVMEAQWLPANVKKGYLTPITAQVAKGCLEVAHKTLDATAWGSKQGKGLNLPFANQPRGDFSLEMLPVSCALERLKDAPSGTVLVVVRAARPSQVTRISHLGFLVRKKERLYLRHASRTFGKVTDEPLENFLARNLHYARWTVAGFALYAVTEPAPETRSTVTAPQ